MQLKAAAQQPSQQQRLHWFIYFWHGEFFYLHIRDKHTQFILALLPKLLNVFGITISRVGYVKFICLLPHLPPSSPSWRNSLFRHWQMHWKLATTDWWLAVRLPLSLSSICICMRESMRVCRCVSNICSALSKYGKNRMRERLQHGWRNFKAN